MIKNALAAFADLPDPRREHPQKLHKLIDIVVIALCAMIAKCETWEEIADYGVEKEAFFDAFLNCLMVSPHTTLSIASFHV